MSGTPGASVGGSPGGRSNEAAGDDQDLNQTVRLDSDTDDIDSDDIDPDGADSDDSDVDFHN